MTIQTDVCEQCGREFRVTQLKPVFVGGCYAAYRDMCSECREEFEPTITDDGYEVDYEHL